jgi:hypothetical protein
MASGKCTRLIKKCFNHYFHLKVDQPDLALPREMYLDQESYAEYIQAYKDFIVQTAVVITRYFNMRMWLRLLRNVFFLIFRELGENVVEEKLRQSAENIFQFERFLAIVSAIFLVKSGFRYLLCAFVVFSDLAPTRPIALLLFFGMNWGLLALLNKVCAV